MLRLKDLQFPIHLDSQKIVLQPGRFHRVAEVLHNHHRNRHDCYGCRGDYSMNSYSSFVLSCSTRIFLAIGPMSDAWLDAHAVADWEFLNR